jgi:phenylacetate-CoA ligase
MMAEGGARALGCPVVPGGTGRRAPAPGHRRHPPGGLRRHALVPPDPAGEGPRARARHVLHHEGARLRRGVPGATRDRLGGEFGIEAYQCYATADLGLIAYESAAREGLVADESLILEIVRPGTGDPVPDGEVGEVVVTAFNPDYP